MIYDAVAISTADLSAGSDFFQRSTESAFPWVAANVFDNKANRAFSPHVIKMIGDLVIGIIGLTGTSQNAVEDFDITDWRQALQREITLLEKSCDILVVLSNLNSSENLEIQRDFKQVDIIVTADKNGKNIQPLVTPNSLLIQSGDRGKYLGKLDITWQGSSNWLDASSQSINQQKNRLRSIDNQLRQLERQQSLTGRDVTQKMARLQSSRQIISDQIIQKTADLAEQKIKPSNSFKSYFLPVIPKSTNDNVGLIVQDIKRSKNAFNRYRRKNIQSDNSDLQVALENDKIAGITACSGCHDKQTAFWESTSHAKAYTTLSQQGQSFNLQCLPCHVTAGKIRTTSIDSELLYLLTLKGDRQTIGCEVCHGPGKQHLLLPDEITPVRLPDEEICIQCHTPDRDSNFDYQRKLQIIACPSDLN